MRISFGPNFKILDASTNREISADEIREKVNCIMKKIEKCGIRNCDVMFVDMERSIDAVLAVIACLQLELAFTCMSDQMNQPSMFRPTLTFDGEKVSRIADPEDNEYLEICYVINTSGTSGSVKKRVAVPVTCIWTNIGHFCSLFNVVPSDSILFSTSLLFDPSIVELFMAFHTGCRLILTPDSFRSEPHRMQKVIEEFRPTIAQFTPTVFEMLPSPDSLLSATSSLRILLLGGSHFPLDFINSIRSSDNNTRIFNVYGVTEVSCWASAYEVETGCAEVQIGTAIVGTTLEVDSNQELILGGIRQCYVNGEKGERYKTGDVVERRKNGGLRIVGRVDRMVKHQGIQICLDTLNDLILRETPSVQTSHLIHYKNRNLIQFITSTSKDKENSRLININETTSVMVTTIQVDKLPINSSGKVAEDELRRICDKRFNKTQDIRNRIRKILEERLKVNLDEALDQSFVAIGVQSLMAAEMSLYFGDNQENALRNILDDRKTIRCVLETIQAGTSRALNSEETEIVEVNVTKKRQPRMKWAMDLKKCIDGNVLVIRNDLVVCASHSGMVVAVNPVNGTCLWKTKCNVRYECSPTLVNKEIVIGSKIGGLLFLCVETGEAIYIHLGHPYLGARSKCAFDGRFIYCSMENGCFEAINPETRWPDFHDFIEPNRGGSSVGPVVSPDGSVFATTTSGYVTKILVTPNFRVQFSKRFGPIFAEPLFLDDNVLITSVTGTLKLIDSETGDEMDSITLNNENCFCAPLCLGNKLLVATQAGHIILLNLKPRLEILKVFKFDLPGISFVKTPQVLNASETSAELMMMSKNGWLTYGRFSYSEGFEEVTAVPVSNKEVFTSPEIIDAGSEKLILIAGRDDYLKCFYSDYTHQRK